MTKSEFLDKIKDIPDNAEIDVYNLETFMHPEFEINTESYFNYDTGTPIITIEIT